MCAFSLVNETNFMTCQNNVIKLEHRARRTESEYCDFPGHME